MNSDDTEEMYRQHLAHLISRTKSRGNGRYFNQYVNRCRREATVAYPKGSAAAAKKNMAAGGIVGVLVVLFDLFNIFG